MKAPAQTTSNLTTNFGIPEYTGSETLEEEDEKPPAFPHKETRVCLEVNVPTAELPFCLKEDSSILPPFSFFLLL